MPQTSSVSSAVNSLTIGVPLRSGNDQTKQIEHAPPACAIRKQNTDLQTLPLCADFKNKNITICHAGKQFSVVAFCRFNEAVATINGKKMHFTRRTGDIYYERGTGLPGKGEQNDGKEKIKEKINRPVVIRDSQLYSEGDIVRVLNDWGIPSDRHDNFIAVYTETFRSEPDYFTNKFVPNLVNEQIRKDYKNDVEKVMLIVIAANIDRGAIRTALKELAGLKADLETPRLAEKAKIAMDTIRKNTTRMAFTINLVKKGTESIHEKFQALLADYLSTSKKADGNNSELRAAQEKVADGLKALVNEYCRDYARFTSQLSDLRKANQEQIDQLLRLKTNTDSISSDPEHDIEISASHYEKFDHDKKGNYTCALLRYKDVVNNIRGTIRSMQDMRKLLPSVPPKLEKMAKDIEIGLDSDIAKLICVNEDATSAFNEILTMFLKHTERLSASSNRNVIDKALTNVPANSPPFRRIDESMKTAASLSGASMAAQTRFLQAIDDAKRDTAHVAKRLKEYFNITHGEKLGAMEKSLKSLGVRAENIGLDTNTTIQSQLKQARKEAAALNWDAAIECAREATTALETLDKFVATNEKHYGNFRSQEDSVLKTARQLEKACEKWKLSDEHKKIKDAVKEMNKLSKEKKWIEAWRKLRTLTTTCEEVKSLTAAFDKYEVKNPKAEQPKLQQGRIHEIHAMLTAANEFTAENFQKALEDAYKKQCQVSRETWLNELGFSGEGIIKLDNDCHITVFNDAVAKNSETLDVSLVTDTIIEKLFLLTDVKVRVHVTKPIEIDGTSVRCHRYFALSPKDKKYSPEVTGLPEAEKNKMMKDLDAAYSAMLRHFRNRIDTLRNNHGRPSTGNAAPSSI
jgi:hypothetical protein